MADEDGMDEYREEWKKLPGNAQEVLICLCKRGPTYDGDVPSKTGRDILVDRKLASRCVIANNEFGYQVATPRGGMAYKYGYVEPRKELVGKLVGGRHMLRRH